MSITTALGFLGGLVLGMVVAYINMRVTRKTIKKTTMVSTISGGWARIVLDAGTLAVVYFACRKLGWSVYGGLLGAAVGLSVGGMLFLLRLTKKLKDEEPVVMPKMPTDNEKADEAEDGTVAEEAKDAAEDAVPVETAAEAVISKEEEAASKAVEAAEKALAEAKKALAAAQHKDTENVPAEMQDEIDGAVTNVQLSDGN